MLINQIQTRNLLLNIGQLDKLLDDKIQNQGHIQYKVNNFDFNFTQVKDLSQIVQRIKQEKLKIIESINQNVKQEPSSFQLRSLNLQDLGSYLYLSGQFQTFSHSFSSSSSTQFYRKCIRKTLCPKQSNQIKQLEQIIHLNDYHKVQNPLKQREYKECIKQYLYKQIDFEPDNAEELENSYWEIFGSLCQSIYRINQVGIFSVLADIFGKCSETWNFWYQNCILDNPKQDNKAEYDPFYSDLIRRKLLLSATRSLENNFPSTLRVQAPQTLYEANKIFIEKFISSDQYLDNHTKSIVYKDSRTGIYIWGAIYLMMRSGSYLQILDELKGLLQLESNLDRVVGNFIEFLSDYLSSNQVLKRSYIEKIRQTLSGDNNRSAIDQDRKCPFRRQILCLLMKDGSFEQQIPLISHQDFLWISLKMVVLDGLEYELVSGRKFDKSQVSEDVYLFSDFQKIVKKDAQSDAEMSLPETLAYSFLFQQAFLSLEEQRRKSRVLDMDDLLLYGLLIQESRYQNLFSVQDENGLSRYAAKFQSQNQLQKNCEQYVQNLFKRSGVAEGLLYSIFLFRDNYYELARTVVENCETPANLDKIIWAKDPEIETILQILARYQDKNQIVAQEQQNNNNLQIFFAKIADVLQSKKQWLNFAVRIYQQTSDIDKALLVFKAYFELLVQNEDRDEIQQIKDEMLFLVNSVFAQSETLLLTNMQKQNGRIIQFLYFYQQIKIEDQELIEKTTHNQNSQNFNEYHQKCQEFLNKLVNIFTTAIPLLLQDEKSVNFVNILIKDLSKELVPLNYLMDMLKIFIRYSENSFSKTNFKNDEIYRYRNIANSLLMQLINLIK